MKTNEHGGYMSEGTNVKVILVSSVVILAFVTLLLCCVLLSAKKQVWDLEEELCMLNEQIGALADMLKT